MIEVSQNSDDPYKTISILRRRKTGLLDTAEGLGMPFVAPRDNLMKYLKNEDEYAKVLLEKAIEEVVKRKEIDDIISAALQTNEALAKLIWEKA